jgi:porin
MELICYFEGADVHKRIFVLAVFLLMTATGVLRAQNNERTDANQSDSLWQRETLTNGFYGVGDILADKGIDITLSATQIYQQNTSGGISTHRKAGRYSGSYDAELEVNFEKLYGITGGRMYMLTEGKWSKTGGINDPAVGSIFNVNGDGEPRRAIDVTQLWYEQNFAAQGLRLRAGKLDLTCGFEHHDCPVAFDCSTYANDERTQFLNAALINNPTIPFPENGLGAALHYGPDAVWYASTAVADAKADLRETGFNTTFDGDGYFFYIAEAGITPKLNSANGELPGAYRAGLWYDPQPKANEELAEEGKRFRNDTGFYLTFDQMIIKENSVPEDLQGLGAFFRYGNADGKRNDLTSFWSTGFQYKGLLEDRDEDVLGVGFAHGTFSNSAADIFNDDFESAIEVYYSLKVTKWFVVSPDFQYVFNPGGNKDIPNATVIGARVQMTF